MSGSPIAAAGRVAGQAVHRFPPFTKIVKDWLTDSTGNGYSIGRALAVLDAAVFLVLIPISITVWLMIGDNKPTITEWGAYLPQMALYLGGVVASIVALITLGGVSDPGGAFWMASNAPPATNAQTTSSPTGTTSAVATHAPGVASSPPLPDGAQE